MHGHFRYHCYGTPALHFISTTAASAVCSDNGDVQPNFAKHTSQEFPGAPYRHQMPYHGHARLKSTRSARSDGKMCGKRCTNSLVHIPIAPKSSLPVFPFFCFEESSVCIEAFLVLRQLPSQLFLAGTRLRNMVALVSMARCDPFRDQLAIIYPGLGHPCGSHGREDRPLLWRLVTSVSFAGAFSSAYSMLCSPETTHLTRRSVLQRIMNRFSSAGKIISTV